jgi:hypothetical protein
MTIPFNDLITPVIANVWGLLSKLCVPQTVEVALWHYFHFNLKQG